jgi:hypothetical protein
MTQLGNGLAAGEHHEDALTVRKAELDMRRRLGASECVMLGMQGNLADSYRACGRTECALSMQRAVYSGWLKIYGEGFETLREASNLVTLFIELEHYDEAKTFLRKVMPAARRVLGEHHQLTIYMRWNYATTICSATGATLDDLREAVTTLEDVERIARRALGGAHPSTKKIGDNLRLSRALLLRGCAPARLPTL